eukprot:gene12629-biopygen2220
MPLIVPSSLIVANQNPQVSGSRRRFFRNWEAGIECHDTGRQRDAGTPAGPQRDHPSGTPAGRQRDARTPAGRQRDDSGTRERQRDAGGTPERRRLDEIQKESGMLCRHELAGTDHPPAGGRPHRARRATRGRTKDVDSWLGSHVFGNAAGARSPGRGCTGRAGAGLGWIGLGWAQLGPGCPVKCPDLK